jgi:hypothetical protein
MSLRERSKRGQAAANVADVPSGTSYGTDRGDGGKPGPARTATYSNSRSEWASRRSTPWIPTMDDLRRQRGAGGRWLPTVVC